MTHLTAVGVLALAAGLEAGGDALIRAGLHSDRTSFRVALFLLATAVLFAYGYTVNAPPWSFGRLLGLYVTFFFVFAQALSWLVFQERPTSSIWIGGGLIVVGGCVIAANS